jgi:TRAP-type C4-dicarboxylate transport system permease large subunit
MKDTRRIPSVALSLYVLYISVFLDLFAVSMIIPVLSVVYAELKMDPVTFGFIGFLILLQSHKT